MIRADNVTTVSPYSTASNKASLVVATLVFCFCTTRKLGDSSDTGRQGALHQTKDDEISSFDNKDVKIVNIVYTIEYDF